MSLLRLARRALPCLLAFASIASAWASPPALPGLPAPRSPARVSSPSLGGPTTAGLAPATSLGAAPAGVPSSWLSQVSAGIQASEYRLAVQADGGGWSAPNRAHGFRTTWQAGVLLMTPRTDETAWSFRYELARVGRLGPSGERDEAGLSLAGEQATQERIEWRRGGDLREWYVNDERGIEQGFVVDRRPAGDATAPVAIAGRIEGLQAYPSEDALSVTLRTPAGVDALRIDQLAAHDATGETVPACFDVTAGHIAILIDDRDATYPLTVDPLFTSPSWTAEGNQAYDNYGQSVATAGDVNGDGFSDVIVGAYGFDVGGFDQGRAFVYLGSAAGLSAAPAWTASGPAEYAYFGYRVATAGDVNGDGYSDVVVDAPYFSNGQDSEGAAFLYLGGASGLASTPAWSVEGGQANAYLGIGLGTAGDVNGDGYSDVIVGVIGYSNSQSSEGRLLAFHGSASGLASTPSWSFESNQASANLGLSAATAGDVNGDGYADVLASAPSFVGAGGNQGRIFVFFGSASGLGGSPGSTVDNDLSGYDGFGNTVGTAGDVDGDGFADVLIGFSQRDTERGRVQLHRGSPGGVDPTPAWTTDGANPNEMLGYAAAAGDVNGDGFADVIVGAPGVNNGQDAEGRAYLFEGSATGLSTTPSWTTESNFVNGFLGQAVSTAGDVNGDGFSDVIVGASGYSNGQEGEGRAYVFNGSAAGLEPTFTWGVTTGDSSTLFGVSVSLAGDVNGDGYSDVIVGAAYGSEGGPPGSAFLYEGSAGGLATSPNWSVSGTRSGQRFGYAVSGAGDVNGDGYSDVIVGSPDYAPDFSHYGFGRADVFYGSPSGLSTSPNWSAETSQNGAFFGYSVSTAGDVDGDGYTDVVVGAWGYDDDQADEGRLFVYRGSPSGLSSGAAWTRDGNQVGAELGFSVATAGDVNRDGFSDLAAGAIAFDSGNTDEGRAYVYYGSSTGPAPTPSWSTEGNQDYGYWGYDVATAGDVNGDGYSDLAVGFPYSSVGAVPNAGRALVFHGGSGGLAATPAWTVQGDQESEFFGVSVATAGDVNADGYSDVVVGDAFRDTANPDNGRVLVYHGSASGLSTTPAVTIDPPFAGAEAGYSVSTGGDTDGDGDSDIVFGAPRLTLFLSNQGAAFSARGNGGTGLPRLPRQRRADDSAPIDVLGLASPCGAFRIHAHARSPYGRDRVRLEAEVKPLGTAFNGTGLITTAYVDTGEPTADGSSVDVNALVSSLPAGPSHWRARLRGTFPFPWKSHWMSPAYDAITETDLRGVSCDDGDPSTLDTCDPAAGCVHTAACDDGNACTADAGTPGSCTHSPVNCDDGDPCTVDACDPATGCTNISVCDDGDRCTEEFCLPFPPYCFWVPRDCDDGDRCTLDTCDAATGGCTHAPAGCNDGDTCTTDSCDSASGCSHVAINCDDANACTDDDCNPTSGCTHATHSCDDGSACTTDSCSPAAGCTHAAINCNDGNACTDDGCNPASGCTHVATNCDDGAACTVDSCSPASGCAHVAPSCDDGNACTTDGCNPSTGACTHVATNCDDGNACTDDGCNPASGCTHATHSCDDGNACTTDTCAAASGCAHASINCDDSNACTDDGCNPATGCTHATHSCDDSNVCTTDTCAAASGCAHAAINCDDGNACTDDGCNPSTGCTHVTTNCNDGVACTVDSCNPASGCAHVAPTCDDSNACTTDGCNPSTGACTHVAINCDDGNACTDDGCNPSTGCTHATHSCDDSNACTTDTCSPTTGCAHAAVSCDDGNACTDDGCNPSTGCTHGAHSCDDSNACTNDTCSPTTGCAHGAVSCNDGNACTDDGCNPSTGCTHGAHSCDDGNACTTDTCNPTTGCAHPAVSCDDGNACTNDTCSPSTGCAHPARSCDDGNACTDDGCNPASGCTRATHSCDDGSACTTDTCSPSTGCAHAAVSCDDGNACTTDTCSPSTGCSHATASCDDGVPCTLDTCSPSTGCAHGPGNCDDGNACTTDTCQPGVGCTFTAVNCDDGNTCTDDACNPASGCTHATHSCDDANGCTTDTCNPSTGCAHAAVTCNDGSACTTDTCNPTSGCVFTLDCDDGNACTTDGCNPGGHCTHVVRNCGLVVTCPGAVTVQCDANVPAPNTGAVTTSDTCSAVTVTFVGDVASGICPRTITRTYRGTDSCGNSATCTQIITVRDTTRPTFTSVPAATSAQCSSIPAVGSPTATDNCSTPTISYLGQTMTAGSCPNNYTLTRTWRATDACGNSTTASQAITVSDTTSPTMTRGTMAFCFTTQAAAESAAIAATTATDNCPGTVTKTAVTSYGGAPCAATVSVTARDGCGNVAAVSYVVIIDGTPPTFSGVPANQTLQCNATVPAAPTVTANDACSGSRPVTLTETRTNGACAGTFTVVRTWRATDSCGNVGTATQTITAADTIAPVVTQGSANLYCLWPANGNYNCFTQSQFSPAITDNCTAAPIPWRFVGCTSDQPDDAAGNNDGATVNDCVVRPDGLSFCVRSERDRTLAAGRHYALTIVATDCSGRQSAPTRIGYVFVAVNNPGGCLSPNNGTP